MIPRAIDSIRSLHCGIALAAVSVVAQLPAQPVREGWRQSMWSSRVVLDHQNNICTNTSGPLLDFYATKSDPRGNVIWVERFGDSPSRESSKWLAVDSVGNVILTGHRSSVGMLTVKFGANGSVLWAHVDPTVREGYRVEVDALDNIYVAGVTFDPRNRDDFVTVKYDPAGNVVWRRQRDFFGNQDQPTAMAVTAAGTVAVTGGSSNDMATVVYDTFGNEMFFDWRLASPGQDIVFGPDGSVYVCGGAVGAAALLVALDPSGAEAWTVQHSGPNGPFGYATRLAVDSLGNIVAIGHTDSTTAYMDWMVFKVDPVGNVLWGRTFDGFSGDDEFARAVAIGPDDSVYVTGSGGVTGICSPISRLGEVVRRYAADGSLLWHHEEACGGGPRSVVIERFGDIVLGGGSQVVWLEQRDWMTLGAALGGSRGIPNLDLQGFFDASGSVALSIEDAPPTTAGVHVIGGRRADLGLFGGTMVPYWDVAVPFWTDANGRVSLSFRLPGFLPIATELYWQSWLLDPAAPQGLVATDAVVKALQ